MARQHKLRTRNLKKIKSMLHYYQRLPPSKTKFGERLRGKSSEFDVVVPVEEEDFIQIDGSYKRFSSAEVFSVAKPKKQVQGLSMEDWVRFKFGGFRASESFGKLALLDCDNDFHLISFDLATMHLKKDFQFSTKDFEVPWRVSCFDFFDKGNLLVGFDTISQDFCAFNLRKRKKNIIKGAESNRSGRERQPGPPQPMGRDLRPGHRERTRVCAHLRHEQGQAQAALQKSVWRAFHGHLFFRAGPRIGCSDLWRVVRIQPEQHFQAE